MICYQFQWIVVPSPGTGYNIDLLVSSKQQAMARYELLLLLLTLNLYHAFKPLSYHVIRPSNRHVQMSLDDYLVNKLDSIKRTVRKNFHICVLMSLDYVYFMLTERNVVTISYSA